MEQCEAKYLLLEEKFRNLIGRFAEVEAVLDEDYIEDLSEEEDENDNISEELSNLIAESKQRRDI